jgi:hypothetical protein
MSSTRAGREHHRWLRALMLNEVGGVVDGADVITVDEGALRQ